MTPEQRATRARIAGATFAATHDMREVAARARQGKWERYLREVDPDGLLSEVERTRRARAAQKAEMSRLALKASHARAQRRGVR